MRLKTMQTFQHIMTDEEGLHARPAGLLAKFAQSCPSSITMSYQGKSVDAKRLFAIMSLCVKTNDSILFQIEGEQESRDCENLKTFCRENL